MTEITNTGIKGGCSDFNELRIEASILQKKGLPFMLSSVVIWTLVTIVRLIPQDIMVKNLYTFYCMGLLVPCALFFALLTRAKTYTEKLLEYNSGK
ncbi:MAG: hypothetical protein IJ869_06990 [Clostridiales bacterium]|nr:hypothetical protein [Clostridiales bacterium]